MSDNVTGNCDASCGIGTERAGNDIEISSTSGYVEDWYRCDGVVTPHLHVVSNISSSRVSLAERNFATSLLRRLQCQWFVKHEDVKCDTCLHRYLDSGDGRTRRYRATYGPNDNPPFCESCCIRALSRKQQGPDADIGDGSVLPEGPPSVDTGCSEESAVAVASSAEHETTRVQRRDGSVADMGPDGLFCTERLFYCTTGGRSKPVPLDDEGLPETVGSRPTYARGGKKRKFVRDIETTLDRIQELSIINGAFMESDINALVLGDPQCRYLGMSPRWGSLLQQMGVRIRCQIREKDFEERCALAWAHYRNDTDYLTPVDSAKTIISILMLNDINWREFTMNVNLHAKCMTGKKNCFAIIGRPSTGKSAILESIIKCHWNYVRLNSFSRFNTFCWQELIGANAGFMDEIHVDGPQFETWKLIAAGQDVAVDVKYKGKGTVKRTPLYVASNGEIHQYAIECTDRVTATAARCFRYDFRATIPVKTDLLINPGGWKILFNICSKGPRGGPDFPAGDEPYIEKDAESIVSAFIDQ